MSFPQWGFLAYVYTPALVIELLLELWYIVPRMCFRRRSMGRLQPIVMVMFCSTLCCVFGELPGLYSEFPAPFTQRPQFPERACPYFVVAATFIMAELALLSFAQTKMALLVYDMKVMCENDGATQQGADAITKARTWQRRIEISVLCVLFCFSIPTYTFFTSNFKECRSGWWTGDTQPASPEQHQLFALLELVSLPVLIDSPRLVSIIYIIVTGTRMSREFDRSDEAPSTKLYNEMQYFKPIFNVFKPVLALELLVYPLIFLAVGIQIAGLYGLCCTSLLEIVDCVA